MRNKIDYGIDLGTTNSAIARMENGVPSIKKSETLKDTIPSCVNFNRKQDILVGDTAYNVLRIDSARALKSFEKSATNTYIEFKRMMGINHKEFSSNMDKEFTPEELSAEVLKKLKSFITDENISSIVITVPAKFQNPQNEATINAARIAGFKHIVLLQEPVAAATAYGLNSKNKNDFWLVFDFGGGTFDAALIKSDDGILSVKDTDGDNWLGGKNLDEAIVDNLLIPYIANNYSIEFVLDDTGKRELLRTALKFHAEKVKNDLSFNTKSRVLTELGDLPFEDENGDEPELDIELSQEDLAKVLQPIFQKAIDISLALLKRNNLKGSDLGALILVGGPTYSPILRKMLSDQITQKVDTSVDPMTVVAKGAALYASTISVSEEVKESSRDKTKLQLDIKYDATSIELDPMVNIKILKDKTEGTYPQKIFAEVIRFDSGYSSGKKLISEKASILDLVLIEGRSNSFTINVYDESDNLLECQPNQFSILQGIAGLEGMQVLPYHIGIAKYFLGEEKDLFKPIRGLEKNNKVPATGVINDLKTRSQIRPGVAEDIIRIPIYEGEYNAEGTNPALNNLISEVIISGETIPALLPIGSPVEITIKVNASREMSFSANFPTIEHTEELPIEVKLVQTPDESELRKEIAKAKKTAQRVKAINVESKLSELENQLENEGGSADGKLKILDGLRKELLALDGAEKGVEWPKVEKELKESFYALEELIDKIKENGDDDQIKMEKVDAHLNEYRTKIEHIIKEKNVRDAKELSGEIASLDFQLRNAVTGNAIDVQFLKHFNDNFNSLTWKNPTKARQLVNQGTQMANNGNTSGIRNILIELVALLPENERPTTLG